MHSQPITPARLLNIVNNREAKADDQDQEDVEVPDINANENYLL